MTGEIGRYLAMGGYAAFVWPAYGVALAVLGGLAWQSWRRYRASSNMLERLQRELRSQAMTRKQQRLGLLALAMAALGGATALVLVAFSDNLVFFYSPSDLKAKAVAPDRGCGSAGSSRRTAFRAGPTGASLVPRHRRREQSRGRL